MKNISGRKSDVLDGQWLQQLMSYGLLSCAFRPKDEICAATGAEHLFALGQAMVLFSSACAVWT